MTARLALDTPLWESAPLSARLGGPVWLKMESRQPSGSFKLRGMERVCADFAARGIGRLVASSGGNAGIAAAYAARRLGLELVVVVPRSTPERARRRIEAEGARVRVEGEVWADADRCARALAEDPGMGYVHPYDHPLLWACYADLVEEVARSLRPGCVVLSVGGGGLLAGVLEGLDRVGWSALPVFAADAEIREHAPALVVVCGGVCVDRALLSSWRARVSGGEAALRLAED